MQLPSFPKPVVPHFSSGPCRKYPTFDVGAYEKALLGRSHRSEEGIERLKEVMNLIREVLEIPTSHKIAFISGSTTGALETALWNFLGPRPVDIFSWDVFGNLWLRDAVDHLKLPEVYGYSADFGSLPDMFKASLSHDCVFVWNGTTAGVCVPHLEWISSKREGLTICDATSSVFCLPIKQWEKLDVTAFSWQKGLGGEAGIGVLVLGPRALERLETYTPTWPIPRLIRLKSQGKIFDGLFMGKTLNTISLLLVEDAKLALSWALSIGGQQGLGAKCQENFKVLKEWIAQHPHFHFMAQDPETISPTSVCFSLKDPPQPQEPFLRTLTGRLKKWEVAKDIRNHMFAPPSLRIWCGPTVEREDLERLVPWIDWALQDLLRDFNPCK